MVAEVEFKMPREKMRQKKRTKLRNYMKKLLHETQESGRRIAGLDECVKLSHFQYI